MVPIYICDDNVKEMKYLSKIIENLILIHGYDMQVVLAASKPEEIMEHRQMHTERSVYFLDVDLKHEVWNGFTLAKWLRELDTGGFIVFVTTHEEMMYETFKYRLEAMEYLIKDEPTKLTARLRECLDEINHLISNEKKDIHSYYTVKVEDCVFHIPMEEILYFETAGEPHRVILHAKDRVLEFRGDLSTMQKETEAVFLKVHRSYLVKPDKIRQVNYRNDTIVMEGGSTCLLSRKGKRLLKDYFNEEV